MSYPLLHARSSSAQRLTCLGSLCDYPVKYVDARHRREDFERVKLGWLLAPALDGPLLVYREEDLPRVYFLRDLLTAAQDKVWQARGALASRSRDASLKARYSDAIKALRRANGELVRLAMGYSWPGEFDEATGARCCFLFDGDPYEPENRAARRRLYAPPARR